MYYANVESIIKDYCMTIRHPPNTHLHTTTHTQNKNKHEKKWVNLLLSCIILQKILTMLIIFCIKLELYKCYLSSLLHGGL